MLAYSPKIAKASRAGREERLKKADAWIGEQVGKLASPGGSRGRKPTVQGTYDRIRDYLRDHGLLALYEIRKTRSTGCCWSRRRMPSLRRRT